MHEMNNAAGIFATAARCADCPDAECVKACPEQVDLRQVFRYLAAQAPLPVAWKASEKDAVLFADNAIETSFTPWFQ